MPNKIAVLLAAYNGDKWISEQIESIISQKNTLLQIFVSIDFSVDQTFTLLHNLKRIHSNIEILPYGETFGGAAKNFYRLIKDVDFSDYDYVAFSDQDDIWMSNKLEYGIQKIELNNIDAYSSDVIAFWSDGRTKYIKKSYPQKSYDYIFESAGPGCTYIIKTYALSKFKSLITLNWSLIQNIECHDWFIYAFFRTQNLSWVIDPLPLMYYRQHKNNQFGANVTIKSYISRFKLINSGWYLNQIYITTKLLNIAMPNKYFVCKNLLNIRRNNFDAIFLSILFIIKLKFNKLYLKKINSNLN